MTEITDELPDMPCQEIVEVVTAYLDGALSEMDHELFEAHLGVCEECRHYVEQVRRTIEVAGTAAPAADELPGDLRDGLRRAFTDWSSERRV